MSEEASAAYIHGRCHPTAPTWTCIDRIDGRLIAVVSCAECELLITHLRLAEETEG